MSLLETHVIYALAWLSFGFGHSVLASSPAKDRFRPKLGAYYRLSYNIFAVVHILAVWLIGYFTFASAASFTVPEMARLAMGVMYILGVIFLLIALRSYDLGRLAGTTQIRNFKGGIDEPEDEPLNIKGLHAYVRHPLYACVYVILWAGAQDDFGLATAIWGSAYLAVGTYFEERRLLSLYGGSYQAYQTKVPALIPWRGRVG
ncbi:MAG: isoprenylcysteine carboxylmethyltransferase family protein [Rhodospirillaceae bacterium]|jgi:methanethiol S-methyltransferase|nr:isoprenylcysteine carboxylmethyltransferase family protein [Rhodospirillaceae bacterium]MBT4937838.1 isoprenylcysteine carboxylmethyltransferase family protein [Rhodospirillaceae bacterium]MBT7267268.1 isoprenylcysteine carboxylmethyltransferase family protein [Rhodospirillaceae bacterium]